MQRSFVLQGNSQQALDVLQTGLAHQEGVGRSRLQLAMAEVEASSSNWVQMCDIVHDILTDPTNVVRLLLQAAVSEHAGQIAYVRTNTPMPASAAKLQAEASAVCVRALLVQGHDQEAARLAQQVSTDNVQAIHANSTTKPQWNILATYQHIKQCAKPSLDSIAHHMHTAILSPDCIYAGT